MKFPFSYQSGNNDCGPTCLKMVTDFYGHPFDLEILKNKFRIGRKGVTMLSIHKAAMTMGFRSKGFKLHVERLREIKCPVIIFCTGNHFAVIYKMPAPGRDGFYYIADPGRGRLRLKEKEFIHYWTGVETKKVLSDLPLVYILSIVPGKKSKRCLPAR